MQARKLNDFYLLLSEILSEYENKRINIHLKHTKKEKS